MGVVQLSTSKYNSCIVQALSNLGRQSKLKRDEGASYQCNQPTTFPRACYAAKPDQKQVKKFNYLEYPFAQGLIIMFKHFNMMAVSHSTP